MKALLGTLKPRLVLLLRSVGPYAVIEFLLPGGSIVALLYWWYRNRVKRTRDIPIAVHGERLRSPTIFRRRPSAAARAAG